MLKIVFIDDEDIIIKGLKVLIDWASLDIEIAGEAYDGEEGINLIKDIKPDIVISDIRMPVLNGLNVLGMIHDFNSAIRVILLSGYSDFEYAKEAIEKGAFCYLLKPISKSELTEKIIKAKEEILQGREINRKEEKNKQTLRDLTLIAQKEYLKDVLMGKNASLERINEIWSVHGFDPNPAKLCIAVFEPDNSPVPGFSIPEELPILKNTIDNIIEEILIRENVGLLLPYTEKTALIMYFNDPYAIQKGIFDTVNEIKETVYDFIKATLSVGIGSVCDNSMGLAKSFKDANYALESKFLYGNNVTINICDIVNGTDDSRFNPTPILKEIVHNVEICDKSRVSSLLEHLFEHFRCSELNSPVRLYIECVTLLALLRQSGITAAMGQEQILEKELFSIDFYNKFKTYQELLQWMKNKLFSLIDNLNSQSFSHSVQLINDIKRHIDNNYATSTRESVARVFYLNPSYLSQIFKNNTGYGLTNYLTYVRMEKAKKLLLNTDYQIQHIALEIGYNTSQYFSRVFEKYFGVTPSEYRNNPAIRNMPAETGAQPLLKQ